MRESLGKFWSAVVERGANLGKWKGWEALAAVAALLAALASWQAAVAAKDVPRRQAIYQARHEALRDYTLAEGRLHAVLITNPVDLPFSLDDSATLDDPQKLLADGQVARSTVDKYYDYATAANAARSVWSSDKLEDAIRKAGASANLAVACYKDLAFYKVLDPEERGFFSMKLIPDCKNLDAKVDAFDDDTNSVIKMMRDDLDLAWTGPFQKRAGR